MPRTTLLIIILTAVLTASVTAATVALTMPAPADAGGSDVAVLRDIRTAVRHVDEDVRHVDEDLGSEPRTSLLTEIQQIELKISQIYSRQAFVCRAISEQPLTCPSPVG